MQIVKSKREMRCDPFLGDQEAKIVGKWIRKIEKTLIQIKVLDELMMVVPLGFCSIGIVIRRSYNQ